MKIQELFNEIKNGNTNAVGELHRKLRDHMAPNGVFSHIYIKFRVQPVDREDINQDIVLLVWKKIIDGECDLMKDWNEMKSYSSTICYRKCQELAKKLSLMRNHGLKDRNNCEVFAYNSRLDTIQAAIANYKIKKKLDKITKKRISNANLLDNLLSSVKQITIPKRKKYLKEVFHLYQINVIDRDKLMKYLIKKNIDAKVHYPIPIHLLGAFEFLEHKEGDFPKAESAASEMISLPMFPGISEAQQVEVSRALVAAVKDSQDS